MITQELRDRLSHKQIVFTFSTGRCGTNFLTKIMELQPIVFSVHESNQRLDDVRWRFKDNPGLKNEYIIEKLELIADAPKPVYFESSHLNCKEILIPLIANGIEFNLIFLYRTIKEVALSMYHLNDIPGRTKSGIRWLLDPTDEGNILPIDPDNYTDIQLCIWYCLEMQYRQEAFHQSINKLGWINYTISLDRLKKLYIVNSMFRHFNLPLLNSQQSLQYENLCDIKHNDKIARKWHLSSKGIVRHLGPDWDYRQDIKYVETSTKPHINKKIVNYYSNLDLLYVKNLSLQGE